MAKEHRGKYLFALTDKHHSKLKQLALDRSAQLGERVGMGFVIEELIDLHEHMLAGTPDPKVYGSQE